MEINIAKDGIKNTDEATALIYYGRYEVSSWKELYFVAVKTLYIEYPEIINSLVSRDDNRDLYLRTTTINMLEPVRLGTILYLDVKRQPESIVRAIREIFHRAGVININMSIEIRRNNNSIKVMPTNNSKVEVIKQEEKKTEIILKPNIELEVPSFMKSESIIKLNEKDKYIKLMKFLVKKYPEKLKNHVGKYIKNRQVTLAESTYRYFKESVPIGNGLNIEVQFTDNEFKQISDYYLNLCSQREWDLKK